MSFSKFIIGGIAVAAILIGVVPLFVHDMGFNGAANPLLKTDSVTTSHSKSEVEVIGYVNNKELKIPDLSPQDRQALFDAQEKLYKTAENLLQKKYFEDFMQKYMKDKKIDDLYAAQEAFIHDYVKVSEGDVESFLKENGENPQLKSKSKDQQKSVVRSYLQQKQASQFFQGIVAKAEEEGHIKVTAYQLPQRPVVDVDVRNSPTKGNLAAKITIVEFGDFVCPYCQEAHKTMTFILKKYEGKIKFVFKNFPLVQIHPMAMPAAIAASCAEQQGRFWEMYDLLFEHQRELDFDTFQKFARELKLDTNKFEMCQKDSKIKSNIEDEIRYAESIGVGSTPVFYVNGREISGALPPSEFEKVLEAEF